MNIRHDRIGAFRNSPSGPAGQRSRQTPALDGLEFSGLLGTVAVTSGHSASVLPSDALNSPGTSHDRKGLPVDARQDRSPAPDDGPSFAVPRWEGCPDEWVNGIFALMFARHIAGCGGVTQPWTWLAMALVPGAVFAPGHRAYRMLQPSFGNAL